MRLLTTQWTPRAFSSDFFGEVDKFFANDATATFTPYTKVTETDTHTLVAMDVPGVKLEDIKIETEGDLLTVSGERKNYGTFSRSFTLPSTIDTQKVEARLENGVLELHLPKAEAAKPRRIEIQSGKSEAL
jgi:HSP20 family protein